MTRGDISVYVGYLQRNQQAPMWRHIRHLRVPEFSSRKQTKVCRDNFSAELAPVDDGVSHPLLMQGMVMEVMREPVRAESWSGY